MRWGRLPLLGLLLLAACAGPAPTQRGVLRLSELPAEGDSTRQASLRLVVQGLDADARGMGPSAEGLYARAIQVDPNNPYAYLALARKQVELGRLDAALASLDRAEALFDAEASAASAEAHLSGLRGAALLAKGYGAEARERLQRAALLDPVAWGDGDLRAVELR